MIKERAQFYVFPFPSPSAVVGLQQLGAAQTIDSDAPFRLYGVAVAVYGGTAGDAGTIALRFSRPDGSWIQKNLIPGNALIPFDTGISPGAAGLPGANFLYFQPVSPNLLYAPRTTITVDIEDLPGNSHTQCLVIFIGTKLFNPGQFYSPELPANFRALPFLSYPLQILASQMPVFNLPFNIDNDAGFCWQYGSHTAYDAGGATSGVAQYGVIIRDWTGKSYMNDYVPIELIFGFDNMQIPGIPYPEIYIPRQQGLTLDVKVLP